MMGLSKAISEKASVEVLHKKKKIALLILLFWAMGGLTNNAYAQAQAKHYQTRPEPHFKPNKGQVADYEGNQLPEFEYVYQAPGMKLGLKKNGFSYNLYTVEEASKTDKKISEATGKPVNADQQPEKLDDKEKQTTYHYHRVEVAFKGANEDPKIIAGKQTDYYANYYLGYLPEPVTNVHGYRKLTYKNLYDNIDLVLTRKKDEKGQEKLKYDIVVHPGGDLSEVKMAYKGMEGLSNRDGHLKITTSQGSMTETIPESYWAESKAKAKVKYHVEGNVVSFKAYKEKKDKTLIVDPSLKWSTYLGGYASLGRGSGFDAGNDVTHDSIGNVYVTGKTGSSNFPTTSGAYDKVINGLRDAFISKFTSKGSLSWSTFLGGDKDDAGHDVTTYGLGDIYVTGKTESSGLGSFPTVFAYQPSYGGSRDAFLSKFTDSGSLSWSTFLGGSDFDEGKGVTTDTSGNVYVTGWAKSSNFPTNNGAYKDSLGGSRDAFLSKFTSSGSLRWSTYLGGGSDDRGKDLTTDGSENIYITGKARSGFPTTKGTYQDSFGGGNNDAFISKFSSAGSLSWSTYLGGSNNEAGAGVTTDTSGNVYVTGSADSSFPTTNGVYQTSFGGGDDDAFISKLNNDGSLSWSTYLGGANGEGGSGITTDSSGNIYVTGSAESGFPTTNGAFQSSFGGGTSYFGGGDAFLSKFSSSGSLSWSTYLGGSEIDIGSGVTADGSGDVYLTGQTESTNFPTTSGAYQRSYVGGFRDAFLSRFNPPKKPNAGFVADAGCFGDTLLFVDTSSLKGNDTITRYDWHFDDGDSASGHSVNHFYDTTGTYEVELIVTTKKGGRDAAMQRVTVNPVPQAAFSTTDVCLGDSVEFTNQTQFDGNNANLAYKWVLKNAAQDTLQAEAPKFEYQVSGDYSVELIVRDTTTGCETVDTQKVSVFDQPLPGFATNSICENQALTITDTSQYDGRGTLNYQYAIDGDTLKQPSPSVQNLDTGQFNINQTLTTSTGCHATQNTTIEVYPAPQAAFESGTGLCLGDTLSFTNNTQFKGSPDSLTYTWSLGNGDTLRTREPEYAYETAGDYTVELTATSEQGCSSSESLPVQVGDTVTSAFNFESDSSICMGDTLSFINNTQFEGSLDSLTYTWTLGNGDTLRTREPEYGYETAGEFKVELTATSEQGCSSSESRNLEIGDTVSSAFTFEKVNNETVSFDAASEDALRYNWDFGDGVQSDSINPIHTYDSNRKYQVTLTVLSSDGCATTSTNSLELKFLGIDQNAGSKEGNFSAYPNPFEQTVNVDYTLNEGSTVRLEVFDADGRRVSAPLQSTQQTPGEHTYQLNLNDAKVSAVYFLRLTIDENVYVKRIFKAK